MTARYSPAELADALGLVRAHRRAGRGHRRAAGTAGGHRRGGRGQDRDDGRAGGVAGRQRLRRPRSGAGADLHPQGRRPAAAPGPVPAGPARRRRVCDPGGERRRRRAPRASAPTTRSPARCCASTACCCRSNPTPGCSAKPSCGSWPSRGLRPSRRAATPRRRRPRSPRWCCGCRVSWPSTWSTPTSCATPTSSWNGWSTPCPPARASATPGPTSGCCGCWPPRPSAPSWCR